MDSKALHTKDDSKFAPKKPPRTFTMEANNESPVTEPSIFHSTPVDQELLQPQAMLHHGKSKPLPHASSFSDLHAKSNSPNAVKSSDMTRGKSWRDLMATPTSEDDLDKEVRDILSKRSRLKLHKKKVIWFCIFLGVLGWIYVNTACFTNN